MSAELAWLDDRLAAAGIERTGEPKRESQQPWDRALSTLPADTPGEHADATFIEMASLLDESYLGPA